LWYNWDFCGIIALVIADKGKNVYDSSPKSFSLSSFNNLKVGKICAIIDVFLSTLYLNIVIIVLLVGAGFRTLSWVKF
jgi:hypothetical protein